MGIFYESHPDHEGYAIGYVERENCPGSGLYRELAYPDDDQPRPVALISAGCDCGWRSPRFKPSTMGARVSDWGPFSVNTTDRDDDRVRELHHQHIEATPA